MNLEELFKLILLSSAMGSVVALLIISIRTIFAKQLNAHWGYYIWFLLIVRLILPLAPESPMSLFNVFVSSNIETVIPVEYNRLNIESNNQITHPNGEKQNEEMLHKETHYTENFSSEKFDMVENAQVNALQSNKSSLWLVLTGIWLAGAIILALYTLIVNLKLLISLKNKPSCSSKNIIAIWNDCKQKMNINYSIPVIVHSQIKTPTIFSFFKPKLILPVNIVDNFSEDEIKYVFLHELAHVKRLDILTNWLMVIVQILHWFNPVIWYALYKMKQDCEISCDATVLSYINEEEHSKYGMTIINILEMFSNPSLIPGTSSIIKSNSGIKRRITMITKFKKHSLKVTAVAICIFLAMGLVALTNPVTSKETDKSVEKSSDIVWELKELIRIRVNQGETIDSIIKPYLLLSSHSGIDDTWYKAQVIQINNLENPNFLRAGELMNMPIYNAVDTNSLSISNSENLEIPVRYLPLEGYVYDEQTGRFINRNTGIWYIVDEKGYRVIPPEQYIDFAKTEAPEGINIYNRPNDVWELHSRKYITVKEGDTLGNIITQYAINHPRMNRDWYSKQILEINNITDPNSIKINDVLNIPIYIDNGSEISYKDKQISMPEKEFLNLLKSQFVENGQQISADELKNQYNLNPVLPKFIPNRFKYYGAFIESNLGIPTEKIIRQIWYDPVKYEMLLISEMKVSNQDHDGIIIFTDKLEAPDKNIKDLYPWAKYRCQYEFTQNGVNIQGYMLVNDENSRDEYESILKSLK